MLSSAAVPHALHTLRHAFVSLGGNLSSLMRHMTDFWDVGMFLKVVFITPVGLITMATCHSCASKVLKWRSCT